MRAVKYVQFAVGIRTFCRCKEHADDDNATFLETHSNLSIDELLSQQVSVRDKIHSWRSAYGTKNYWHFFKLPEMNGTILKTTTSETVWTSSCNPQQLKKKTMSNKFDQFTTNQNILDQSEKYILKQSDTIKTIKNRKLPSDTWRSSIRVDGISIPKRITRGHLVTRVIS